MRRALAARCVVTTLLAAAMGCGDYSPVARTYVPVEAGYDPRANDTPGGFPGEVPATPSLLEVKTVTPVRLTEEGDEVALEPHDAVITLTIVQWNADDEPETYTLTAGTRIPMPFTLTGGAVGFGFWRQVELRLRVAGSDYAVECDLVFDPDGNVQGAARVDAASDFEFSELLCPGKPGDVGLLLGFRVAPDPRPPSPDLQADSACDSSPLPARAQTAVGLVSCSAFDTMSSPTFEVRIWAEPLGPISGETSFEVQAQLINPEDIVNAYSTFLGVAILAEASVELAQLDGSNPITVAVSAPCKLDYTGDPDGNGTPGPIAMTTGIETAVWTAVNDSVTVEATDMTFLLGSPGVTASTSPVPDPGCTWLEVPRLTFGFGAF